MGPPASPLYRAPEYNLIKTCGKAQSARRHCENCQGGEQRLAPAESHAEPARRRHANRRADHGGGQDPRNFFQAGRKIALHLRQDGVGDGRIEGLKSAGDGD